MTSNTPDRVKVWDGFVRIAHWLLVAGFFVAYFTEDDLLPVHVWAGYLVGLIVLLRVVWGFVGPDYARFSTFAYGPVKAVRYLFGLMRRHGERYLGHSPAGGAMVILLLICLAATVWSGLTVYAYDKGAGPLAALFPRAAPRSISGKRSTSSLRISRWSSWACTSPASRSRAMPMARISCER
jgi:cytochrome b